jgi:hypothetical protein
MNKDILLPFLKVKIRTIISKIFAVNDWINVKSSLLKLSLLLRRDVWARLSTCI